jgi:hypothetical protein
MERWDDRLSLKGNIWWKTYVYGGMTFVLECQFLLPPHKNFARTVKQVQTGVLNDGVLIILKSQVSEAHKFDNRNQYCPVKARIDSIA